ncbi:hypothetical protein [Nocardia farcinica]|uniref:hypothetical protein n=1 Tax=Nocardia farcinica TaxID=37329 RepID=UPI0024565196|nr:hypothetical protein [Nocardia farcinica]
MPRRPRTAGLPILAVATRLLVAVLCCAATALFSYALLQLPTPAGTAETTRPAIVAPHP